MIVVVMIVVVVIVVVVVAVLVVHVAGLAVRRIEEVRLQLLDAGAKNISSLANVPAGIGGNLNISA